MKSNSQNAIPHRTVHAEAVVAGSRSYRFEVKENARGQRGLHISARSTADNRNASRLIVPENQLQQFHEAYYRSIRHFDPHPKAFRLEELRQHYPNAFQRWTAAEDKLLVSKYSSGAGVHELSEVFQRQIGGILFRLLHLGLIPA